jgi:DNA repair exonuclease SbcCD ATPase subunit
MVFVRKAGQEKRDREHMKSLRQQLNAYQTNLQRPETKIAELEKQLAAAIRDRENQNLTQTPAERVYLFISMNHGRDPHGRRHCVETLAWAEEIHEMTIARFPACIGGAIS